MIKAFRIKLRRRESTAGPAPAMSFFANEAHDLWGDANAQLRQWAKTAKVGPKGEEVEYGITFTDGIELRGLITITRADTRPDLAQAVNELIAHKAGSSLPPWTPTWVGRLVAMTRTGKEGKYTRIKYAYEIGSSQAA